MKETEVQPEKKAHLGGEMEMWGAPERRDEFCWGNWGRLLTEKVCLVPG